jgi:predicted regulator of amino acid metabolism with ACT domain
MTAELLEEVAKRMDSLHEAETPPTTLAYFDEIERRALNAAVEAVVSWASLRALRSKLEKLAQ